MRIDCHLHTSHYSRCSHIPAERACELAIARGLDGVVITEHHIQWPEWELDPYRRFFPELLLVSGMEVTLAEGYDVVCVCAGSLGDIPYFVDLEDLDGMLAPIREDCFCFVAHPFRYRDASPPELERILDWVDGVEMMSGNILRKTPRLVGTRFRPDNDARYQSALASRPHLRPVYNSDAHTEAAVGSVAGEIAPAEPVTDAASLVAALKTHTAREYQDPKLLTSLLALNR